MQNLLSLAKDTRNRITDELKLLLASGDFSFDIHTHIFNKDYVPEKYFETKIPYSVNIDFLMQLELLSDSIPEGDRLLNYANFLEFYANHSTMEMAEYLLKNNPKNTIFCPLMIDFKPGISGKVKKDIFEQLEAMKKVKDKYPANFLPFISINPNNEKYKLVLQKGFSDDYNFFGLKIYSPLGYLPSQPKLMQVFEICEQKNIPITVSSGSGSVHSSKRKLNLAYYILDNDGNLEFKSERKNFFLRKQYEKFFNKPDNWKPVLKKFPNLRINFAHFGSEVIFDKKNKENYKWTNTIIDFMREYPNVYSDVSYILHEPDMFDYLSQIFETNKIVSERLLFGTNFYLTLIEGQYSSIRDTFINTVSKELMHKISVQNPLNFLNLIDFVPQKIKKQWQNQTL